MKVYLEKKTVVVDGRIIVDPVTGDFLRRTDHEAQARIRFENPAWGQEKRLVFLSLTGLKLTSYENKFYHGTWCTQEVFDLRRQIAAALENLLPLAAKEAWAIAYKFVRPRHTKLSPRRLPGGKGGLWSYALGSGVEVRREDIPPTKRYSGPVGNGWEGLAVTPVTSKGETVASYPRRGSGPWAYTSGAPIEAPAAVFKHRDGVSNDGKRAFTTRRELILPAGTARVPRRIAKYEERK